MDVIIYFSGMHYSHTQNYFALHDALNESGIDTHIIVPNSKWGFSSLDFIEAYEISIKHRDKVHFLNNSDAINFLRSNRHKVALLGSNFRKGNIESRDISASKDAGAYVIQVATMPVDFYPGPADEAFAISPYFYDVMAGGSGLPGLKITYGNCILWDDVTHNIKIKSREFLCQKYDLDPDQPILIWTPDPVQCQHENARKIYERITGLPNVLIKLHPNEWRRHKADRVGGRWSFEVYGTKDKPVRVLQESDAASALRNADYVIGYQSSIGMETSFWKTPTIYVEENDPSNLLFNESAKKIWNHKYCWAGWSIDVNEIEDFIKSKPTLTDQDYQNHNSKILYDTSRNSIDILVERVKELV